MTTTLADYDQPTGLRLSDTLKVRDNLFFSPTPRFMRVKVTAAP